MGTPSRFRAWGPCNSSRRSGSAADVFHCRLADTLAGLGFIGVRAVTIDDTVGKLLAALGDTLGEFEIGARQGMVIGVTRGMIEVSSAPSTFVEFVLRNSIALPAMSVTVLASFPERLAMRRTPRS